MINYRLLALVSLLIVCCAAVGKMRLDIDTDMARSLPVSERFIADALEIFHHHPIHDQVAVDITGSDDNQDALVECGIFLEQKMAASGLFAQVGAQAMGELIPRLALLVVRNLPQLLSEEDLRAIEPLLTPDRIQERVGRLHADLGALDGIGQAEFIAADPLGLKDMILAKMSLLAPAMNARFYKGHLLSGDGRRLLVTARPLAAGSNTASARAIAGFFEQAALDVAQKFGPEGIDFTLTPVGAYRAALDNETMIRHDVQFALLLSTAGIALLLFLSFSRPLIGLLALVPSFAGTAAALLVYSLFRSSISIMVLGFGGALISITVDYGIAYLLFLDRPHETRGKEAAHEVKTVGIMALATTLVAFLSLCFSGFPVFVELGIFAALGVLFSFLFVHTIFPLVFPVMPAGSDRARPLVRAVAHFSRAGLPGFYAAVVVAAGLLMVAKPQAQVNMNSMNTVSQATRAADEVFAEAWGKFGDRVFVMNSGSTIKAIQQHNDLALTRIEEDVKKEILAAAFVPSLLFPGQARAERNEAAWRSFWGPERREQVRRSLVQSGAATGFTEDAFAPFLTTLAPGFSLPVQEIPAEYFGLLGLSENTQGAGLIQFITVTPGKQYDPEAFFARYGSDGKIFDSAFFGKRLATLLFSTFLFIFAIIAISVTLLLFLVNLSLTQTLLTLLPTGFAFICTLGTMNLIGQPLDIPAMMLLSIAILGMGIDYAIFLVRGQQRYRDFQHPSFVRASSSVVLSAYAAMIGFGVLCFAEHALLRSIGISSLLGIVYSLAGSFLLLPPLLNWYFSENNRKMPANMGLFRRICCRYRTVETYPRLFARFKLRYDPLFTDLPRMLTARRDVRLIVDIGCGYGVPACWCAESLPEARIAAIDPDPERVRVAALALGERGKVTRGWAPDMPEVADGSADVVLLLDMLHYVDDATVEILLDRSFQALAPGGILVMRCTVNPGGHRSWAWRLEEARNGLSGHRLWFRDSDQLARLLETAGFAVVVNEVTANPELAWLVGRVDKGAASGEGVSLTIVQEAQDDTGKASECDETVQGV